MAGIKADLLEVQVKAMGKQTGQVAAMVERWSMRNEEMEQHL
jgi:hypothetical protein